MQLVIRTGAFDQGRVSWVSSLEGDTLLSDSVVKVSKLPTNIAREVICRMTVSIECGHTLPNIEPSKHTPWI